MKYGELSLGQIEALVNKLGGVEGAKRFLRGELVVKTAEKIFPIWKIIQIGKHQGAKGYLDALRASRREVNHYAKEIMEMEEFTTVPTVEDVYLVKVSPREFGFTRKPLLDTVIERGFEFGLELCPAEVGPALCLACCNQWGRVCIRLAMDTITSFLGNPSVFELEHNKGKLWFGADWNSPYKPLSLDSEWVFRSRRK